jgi:exopolysaccharide biosynthesis polyprenyl glycosylphosphotransferase
MINLPAFRKIILFLGDLCLLYLCLIIALIIGFSQSFSPTVLTGHLLPFTLLYLFWIAIFLIFDFYELDALKSNLSFFVRITLGMLICLAIAVTFFYFLPLHISPKTNLLIYVAILWAGFLLWRKLAFYSFSALQTSRVIIIGLNQESQALASALKQNPHLGYRLIKVIPSEQAAHLAEEIKKFKIHTLIIAKNLASSPELNKALYQCLSLKINILDLARAYEIIFQKIPIDYADYLWFLENLKEGKKSLYDKTKKITDIILSFLLLIITLPLWIIIPILIKIDSQGPIIYKQKRLGKEGNDFWLYKFRSMNKEAERQGALWADTNDQRITKIGKVLRNLHLDEIPQLINIIKGDISLTGPRPERPEFIKELEKQVPHYHLRLLVKPGFTGWAQIKFRYARSIVDSHEKLQYDLYYIKNRSFTLDLQILLKTFQLFFKKE